MLILMWVQLLLPVALVAWIAAAPPPGRTALVVQVICSVVSLAALALAGVWTFPPWWTPYLAIILILIAGAAHRTRIRRTENSDVSHPGLRRLRIVSLLALGALSSWAVGSAVLGRRTPEGTPVHLAFPLEAGRYLMVNGGRSALINSHRQSATSSDPKFIPWRGNGWAVDIVATDRWGLRATGMQPRDPSAYEIFGRRVLAPCTGVVSVAADERPDMPIPEYDRPQIAGNHILIECGKAHVLLAHLRRGSVLVRAGDRVAVGDHIGAVGNSGGSDEPHLHMHAQRPGPEGRPYGGDPLPMLIDNKFLVRGDRVSVP